MKDRIDAPAPERAEVEEGRAVAAARHAEGGALALLLLVREVRGDAVLRRVAHAGV